MYDMLTKHTCVSCTATNWRIQQQEPDTHVCHLQHQLDRVLSTHETSHLPTQGPFAIHFLVKPAPTSLHMLRPS